MVSQTYDDWRRMLEACAAAERDASAFAEGAPAWFVEWAAMPAADREAWIADVLADPGGVALTVARALGIDKRRRLEWREKMHASTPGFRATDGEINGRVDQVCGAWRGHIWISRMPMVGVTGHPTAASAIEHLERLLGREATDAAA